MVEYRGSKKFGELAAWEFVDEEKSKFDIATLCPPMTFGPVVHPVPDDSQLNESNAVLWSIAKGAEPLPVARLSVDRCPPRPGRGACASAAHPQRWWEEICGSFLGAVYVSARGKYHEGWLLRMMKRLSRLRVIAWIEPL